MEKKIKLVLDEKTKVFALAGLIAIAAAFISFNIVKIHGKKMQDINSKIIREAERLVLRKDIAKVDNLQKEYLSYLAESADGYVLRDMIYVVAKKSGVDIVSIKPLPLNNIGDFTKVSFKIELASTYNQLGKFVQLVETMPELIRVGTLELYKASESLRNEGIGGKQVGKNKTTEVRSAVVLTAYSPAR